MIGYILLELAAAGMMHQRCLSWVEWDHATYSLCHKSKTLSYGEGWIRRASSNTLLRRGLLAESHTRRPHIAHSFDRPAKENLRLWKPGDTEPVWGSVIASRSIGNLASNCSGDIALLQRGDFRQIEEAEGGHAILTVCPSNSTGYR